MFSKSNWPQKLLPILLLTASAVQAAAVTSLAARTTVEYVGQLTKGAVMTRAQVVGDNGPILVKLKSELGTDGGKETEEVEPVGEVGEGTKLGPVYTVSGAEYNAYVERYQRLLDEGGERMARAAFIPADRLSKGLKLAGGAEASTSKPLRLADEIKTVLVLARQDRFSANPDRWTLMKIPFRMDEDTPEKPDAYSLLFNEAGERIDTAKVRARDGEGNPTTYETFSYRVAYFGEGQDAVKQADRALRQFDDRIFGPLEGAKLTLMGDQTKSDSEGYYSFVQQRPCVAMQIGGETYILGDQFEHSLLLELSAQVYNPRGSAQIPMYLRKKTEFVCGEGPTVIHQRDFFVDLIWLNGKVRFANEPHGDILPVGDKLEYSAEDRSGGAVARDNFDFDGDGEADNAFLANKKKITDEDGNSYSVPKRNAEAEWQAVYFSSSDSNPDADDPAEKEPDIWRRADEALNTEGTGRLSQLSRDALINTDVYIFRESTGELVVQMNGLPGGADEDYERRLVDNGTAYTWDTVMRGPRQQAIEGGLCRGDAGCILNTLYNADPDTDQAVLGENPGAVNSADDAIRANNANRLGFSSRFAGRESRLPAPGDKLVAVAINRTTGYVGSTRFTLGQVGQDTQEGTVTQTIPAITLLPPNLKVWAERISPVQQGLTAGEEREYLIGHEGAATQNDKVIAIYTRWLDHQGRLLPEGLDAKDGEAYGLTGRLSKVSSGALEPISAGRSVKDGLNDTDIEACDSKDEDEREECRQRRKEAFDEYVGAQRAEFPIGPGQNLQLVRLNSDNTANQHFYVTALGRAMSQESGDSARQCEHCKHDDTDGQTGLLKGRYSHYTPLKVPQYDEANALRREQADSDEHEDEYARDVDHVEANDPDYAWTRRPDYQFSLVELMLDEIKAVNEYTDAEGNQQTRERKLIEDEAPVVTSGDDLLEIMYSLNNPESDPLPSPDRPEGDREYVLAVGEEEITLSPDEGEQKVTNLDHLGALTPDGHLTIRVFLAHDPENYLQEFAFKTFGLVADANQDGVIDYQGEQNGGGSGNSAASGTDEASNQPHIRRDLAAGQSQDRPVLFWRNDDDDEGEVGGGKGTSGDVPNYEGAGSFFDDFDPDWDNNKVDGMRDLVDFMPVYLDVGGVIESFDPGEYSYAIRQKSDSSGEAALNLFVADGLKPNSDNDREVPGAVVKKPQVADEYVNGKVEVKSIPADGSGVSLDADFVRKAATGDGGILFLEGRAREQDTQVHELELVIRNSDNEEQASSSFWVRTSKVREMIRHVRMTNVADLKKFDNRDKNEYGHPREGEPPGYPDSRSESEYFVFIHGFNVSGHASRGWHAETYKRLYRLGFAGRFVGVTWHGDTGSSDYHPAVYNAFATSEQLNTRLQEVLPDDGPITLAAHSLGNMVASNAIANEGLDVARYYMINAATPIEAYDARPRSNPHEGVCKNTDKEQPMRNCMQEEDWKHYPERVKASEWHELFPESDPRSKLTWEDRFDGVNTVAYNFYSEGDEVVENPAESENFNQTFLKIIGKSLAFWGESRKGRHAWVAQAIGKGCQHVVAGWTMSDCRAGWKFNTDMDDLEVVGTNEGTEETPDWRVKTANEATLRWGSDAISDEKMNELAEYGLFSSFNYDTLYAPRTKENGNARAVEEARNRAALKETQWEMLAYAIPARTFSAAANSVPELTDRFGKERNIHMEGLRDEGPGKFKVWPENRTSSDLLDDWLHSDIKQVALPYVHQVYVKMLTKMKSKEK